MFPFFPFVALLLLLALPAAAQVASSSWRKPNITTSPADRVNLANAALQQAIGELSTGAQFNDGYGVAGNLYSQMAEFDLATNQSTYEDTLEQYFLLAQENRANFSDELSYGYAAARAYAAYKNPTFLQYAIQSWWFGRSYTLSQDDISSGKNAGKNFSVSKICQDITMAGGTFWNTDLTQPDIDGLGTGRIRYFLVVSALLAEAQPNNPIYLQAAGQSADFIHAHLYNVQNIVQDSISARANDSCAASSLIEPYNSGLMIEGLAILNSITNNASTQSLLNEILLAAIPNTDWQSTNGIIAHKGGDMNLVQGLGAVYARNATTPALRAYVEAYLSVQFNAVIDLATSGGTNIYGSSWVGPPSASFSPTNQTTALSALISAIRLRNDTDASPSSPSASSSPVPVLPPGSSSTHGSPNIGAIIGGVVGGVAALAIGVAIWLIRRHHLYYSRPRPTSLPTSSPILSPATAFPARRFPAEPSVFPGGGFRQQNYPAPVPVPYVSREKRSVVSDRTESSQGSSQPVTEPPSIPHSSTLPTEELLQLLNERLRDQRWDEGEAPPEYRTMPR